MSPQASDRGPEKYGAAGVPWLPSCLREQWADLPVCPDHEELSGVRARDLDSTWAPPPGGRRALVNATVNLITHRMGEIRNLLVIPTTSVGHVDLRQYSGWASA